MFPIMQIIPFRSSPQTEHGPAPLPRYVPPHSSRANHFGHAVVPLYRDAFRHRALFFFFFWFFATAVIALHLVSRWNSVWEILYWLRYGGCVCML